MVLALHLLVLSSLALAQPSHVTVRESVGAGPQRELQFTFPRLSPDPALTRLSLEDARAFRHALEASFQGPSLPTPLERSVLQGYLDLYGPPNSETTAAFGQSRWFQALQRSPRFMPDGVRDSARMLFTSPTVATSLAMSMLLYMMAWAAPEPLFSKALAASITLGLLLAYSTAELHTVGVACLRLYQEAQASRTQEELDAAAERFGKALGGVGLRILLTVAGAKLTRGLSEIPAGSLWARLSPMRLSLSNSNGGGSGISVGLGARAVVSVAGGSLVLMGVSSGVVSSALASSAASLRTTGACREDSNNGDAKRHHIATDKNEFSDNNGGPWTPRFVELFSRADLSLNDPSNLIYLVGHQGPHPQEYHTEVFDRLQRALGRCRTTVACREQLVAALNKIAADICKPDSALNKLTTRQP